MIYVDISNTLVTSAKTGIQRVVRELSWRLRQSVSDLTLIFFERSQGRYLTLATVGNSPENIFTENINFADGPALDNFSPGDVFVEMDAAWGDPLDRSSLLPRLKAQGVIIVCLHFDAVPVLFPDFSHPNTVYRYCSYLAAHLDFADYFICISETVKKDLQKLSLELTNRGISGFTIPLGADFDKPVNLLKNQKNSAEVDELIERLAQEKYLIAVGTVEPRKNHQMLLAAFDLLDKTLTLKLVIVGRMGWNVDSLAAGIKRHPDFGQRLLWLEKVDDGQLFKLYEKAFLSLNVSHYEGYGLPVIESLTHNCVTICSCGGALEEVADGACCILAENSAACLAQNIMELNENQLTYNHYKGLAEKFTPPIWDDSCRHFIEILDHIKSAEDFNWGFVPGQAVYISIDAKHLSYSVESVLENMTFIEEFVLLTADRCKDAMVAVLEKTGKKYTIFTDEEIFARLQLNVDDFSDHQRRNTFLRQVLFQEEIIEANFISFDDDYLVQRKVDPDYYLVGECHFGYSFFDDARAWLGSPLFATSYDAGIWRTGATLVGCGYKPRCFSSHMPQIINKKMASVIYSRMAGMQAEAMDEWSLYFNLFSHLYPQHCRVRNYTAISWPCNPSDWIPTTLPEAVFFENYYALNYEKGGRFYGLSIIGDFAEKLGLWREAFSGQYRQRELNRKQYGTDNPHVELYDDSIKINFTTWQVLAQELLRIRLQIKTESLKEAHFTARLLNNEQLLAESVVDISVARWLPLLIKDEAPPITLELLFHDLKDKRLIDRKTIEIEIVTLND